MCDDSVDLALVVRADAIKGGGDALLHFAQGLALGEADAARIELHEPPIGPYAQFFELSAAPRAIVDIEDSQLDGDGERPGVGERWSVWLQRRGLDFEPFGDLLGLFLAHLVGGDIGRDDGPSGICQRPECETHTPAASI